ncbi:MAG TPA: DUF2905 domain-containing protein [Gemmatimonadota bacterium]|nr:DUF2905 domain-containing protein [Gemmatimonadota bacterium]
MGELARFLIVFGVVSIAVGALLLIGPKMPWLGSLPGDFLIERGGGRIYIPLATSLVLSLVLTLLINLFWR